MSIYKDGKLIAGGRQCMPLLSFMWADHVLNDASWLRADTFSWQSGSVYLAVYKHLCNEKNKYVVWYKSGASPAFIYTKNRFPIVGEEVFSQAGLTTKIGSVEAVSADLDSKTTVTFNGVDYKYSTVSSKTSQTETIAGITITYYLADDGHKICLSSQETNIIDLYAATGVAWYYILDTVNQRFKLPRQSQDHGQIIKRLSSGVKWAEIYSDGWIRQGGTTDDCNFLVTMASTTYSALVSPRCMYAGERTVGIEVSGKTTTSISISAGNYGANNRDWTVEGWSAITSKEILLESQKYLYFYVGQFTQTALENTAGVTTEVLNDKLDLDLGNAASITKSAIIGLLTPDYENTVQHPNNAPATYTTTEPCWICCKGANLAYDMTIGNTTIVEFLFSANYNSSWGFCPAGCTLTRTSTSQYNNFIVVPLKR